MLVRETGHGFQGNAVIQMPEKGEDDNPVTSCGDSV